MVTKTERIADQIIGGGFYNGWPDRLLPTNPPTAIEIKSGKDVLSDEQKRVRDILCASGWQYFVFRVDGEGLVRIYKHVYGADHPISYEQFMYDIGREPLPWVVDGHYEPEDQGRVVCECGWVGLRKNLRSIMTVSSERKYCPECGAPHVR